MEAVQLEDLPGCTLSTMSTARKLRALSLINSQLFVLDSLEGASKLQYVHVKVSYMLIRLAGRVLDLTAVVRFSYIVW